MNMEVPIYYLISQIVDERWWALSICSRCSTSVYFNLLSCMVSDQSLVVTHKSTIWLQVHGESQCYVQQGVQDPVLRAREQHKAASGPTIQCSSSITHRPTAAATLAVRTCASENHMMCDGCKYSWALCSTKARIRPGCFESWWYWRQVKENVNRFAAHGKCHIW